MSCQKFYHVGNQMLEVPKQPGEGEVLSDLLTLGSSNSSTQLPGRSFSISRNPGCPQAEVLLQTLASPGPSEDSYILTVYNTSSTWATLVPGSQIMLSSLHPVLQKYSWGKDAHWVLWSSQKSSIYQAGEQQITRTGKVPIGPAPPSTGEILVTHRKWIAVQGYPVQRHRQSHGSRFLGILSAETDPAPTIHMVFGGWETKE